MRQKSGIHKATSDGGATRAGFASPLRQLMDVVVGRASRSLQRMASSSGVSQSIARARLTLWGMLIVLLIGAGPAAAG
jgi:hypothetical protein